MSSMSSSMLSMLAIFGCLATQSDVLLLFVGVDPKDTLSSNSTRSPKLAADPTLLLAISSERLPPVDPMDDVDEALDDADASVVDSE